MSYVYNYILTAPYGEDEQFETLHSLMNEISEGNDFIAVHNYAGGTRCLESCVFLFAGNYVNVEVIADVLLKCNWRRPEHVQLFLQKPEEDKFTEVDWINI